MSITAREYLVELGLASPGRGKFSKVAKEALAKAIEDGKSFSDWDEAGSLTARSRRTRMVYIPSDQPAPKPEAKPKPKVNYIREENRLRIVDNNGVTMDLEFCSLGHSIQMCTCKTVYAPVYFNAVSSQLIIK